MRCRIATLFLFLSINLSGQENFFVSFGQPDQTYAEACKALVAAGDKVFAITTKQSPGDEYQLKIYQIEPKTGVFLDSVALPQTTPRTVIDAAGNTEGEIFIIHQHGWKDRQVTLLNTRKKTAQHQGLEFPEGFIFDKLWSENYGRWSIIAKPASQKNGAYLLRFSGLKLEIELPLFPDDKVSINDRAILAESAQLLVGSLRDTAALFWVKGDTISSVKMYGKATDKYKVALQYNAFRKVLKHDSVGATITGGYLGMSNEVLIDFDQNYQIVWDTVSKGRNSSEVRDIVSSENGARFYSLTGNYLSVTDRNQEPIYFHNFKTRAKLPRPDWETNDLCLSPDGEVLLTAGSTGRAGKDLNFTLTAYSADLKDTLWHREAGVKGRNTNYYPEGVAANKEGTIFSLIRTPADEGMHQLVLKVNDQPSEHLRLITLARFPEDSPRDAVLTLDRQGQLLVMTGIPGEDASWLFQIDQTGKIMRKTKTPRTSHFTVKPRLKLLEDGRLLATMSVPYIREGFDPLTAIQKGYSTTDYFSMVPCLLIMTPDGKNTRVDSLPFLRKGSVSDVAELDKNELIISGHAQKPMHAGVSRYNLTTRKRTWARSLHRPGFELSRTRSVVASPNKKFYDVLCEYQRDRGKDVDLMIYRFNHKDKLVDSLLIEHRDRQLFGAEMHRNSKGDLLLRYGLGKPPFDVANDDHRLRLVLINGKRLKIRKTQYFDEFRGTTIPYFSTAYGKRGQAILGTMLVDGKYSEDVFLFRLDKIRGNGSK